MKLIGPFTLLVVLQASPGLAQQPPPNEQHHPVVIHNPPVNSPLNAPQRPVVRYAPPQGRTEDPSAGRIAIPGLRYVPSASSRAPTKVPSADRITIPGLRYVPSASGLPGMRRRPIVRQVVVNGIEFGVPAIVAVGTPYVIDVPGLGWVYVPEDEYPTLFAMLTSDDQAQVEAAYTRLQELASVH
jgi:hypothetical protein